MCENDYGWCQIESATELRKLIDYNVLDKKLTPKDVEKYQRNFFDFVIIGKKYHTEATEIYQMFKE